VGGSLSLIIVCIITLTVMMNEKSKKDSLIINISGKQRMLTQKISKEIFYIKAKQTSDFREFNSAIDTFDDNLKDLLYGNEIKGIYKPQNNKIKEKLEEVNVLWVPFKEELHKIERSIQKAKPNFEVFTQKTNTLLDKSDTIVKSMVAHKMNGEFIDLSGRQRMLSQRMGLFIERYLRTDNEEDYLLFVKAKSMYNDTLDRFMNDKNVQNIPEVYASVEDTYHYWKEHEAYMQSVLKLSNSINDSLAYINKNNTKLLNTMDSAVWLYTQYSEEKNDIFIRIQYLSLIIALIIILYAYILSREIVGHINEFVHRAKTLNEKDLSSVNYENIVGYHESEDELIEASSYISSFVKKVNIAMSYSEEAIKKAESAVLELENLADDVENVLKDLKIDEKEKSSFDKKVNATEDIAIESAESLMHVRKMIEKLKNNLNSMVKLSEKKN
jgi:hypothetical protein